MGQADFEQKADRVCLAVFAILSGIILFMPTAHAAEGGMLTAMVEHINGRPISVVNRYFNPDSTIILYVTGTGGEMDGIDTSIVNVVSGATTFLGAMLAVFYGAQNFIFALDRGGDPLENLLVEIRQWFFTTASIILIVAMVDIVTMGGIQLVQSMVDALGSGDEPVTGIKLAYFVDGVSNSKKMRSSRTK